MSSRCAFHFISSLTLNLMMKRTADYPSSSTMKGAFDFAIMSARLWAYLTSDTTWRDFKVLFKGSKNDRMKCALLSPNSSYLFLSYPFFVWIKQTIIPLASPKQNGKHWAQQCQNMFAIVCCVYKAPTTCSIFLRFVDFIRSVGFAATPLRHSVHLVLAQMFPARKEKLFEMIRCRGILFSGWCRVENILSIFHSLRRSYVIGKISRSHQHNVASINMELFTETADVFHRSFRWCWLIRMFFTAQSRVRVWKRNSFPFQCVHQMIPFAITTMCKRQQHHTQKWK